MKRINASRPMMSSAAPPAISTLLFCHQGNSGTAIGSTFGGSFGLTATGVDAGLCSAGLASAGGGTAAADAAGDVASAGFAGVAAGAVALAVVAVDDLV
ncbi:MAG: hypothetical protein KGH92_09020, partial [Xanthomonadaceae bacterium]|nr:hypothetical protein [Xanthomonadaceae bacterium]